jgi:hypothetical protein
MTEDVEYTAPGSAMIVKNPDNSVINIGRIEWMMPRVISESSETSVSWEDSARTTGKAKPITSPLASTSRGLGAVSKAVAIGRKIARPGVGGLGREYRHMESFSK